MNAFETVRDTIGQVCADTLPTLLPGVDVWQTVPDSFAVPAVIVVPAAPTITYGDVTNSDLAGWRFDLWLLLGKVNEHAAQLKAGELVDPKSPLIRALDGAEIPNGWLDPIDAHVGKQRPPFSNAVYEGAKLTIVGNA